MEWAGTPWYVLAVSGVLMPVLVALAKRWKMGDTLKRILAYAVSCLIAAGGLLLDGKFTLETILPNMAIVFTTGMVVYQGFFKTKLGALPASAMMKLVTKVVAPGK